MPDDSKTSTLAVDQTSPTVKPGYLTTEAWFTVAAGLAIFLLKGGADPLLSGLPPLAVTIVALVKPLALAWLAGTYNSSRADVKAAALSAGQTAAAVVTSDPAAAAVVRSTK